MPKMRPSSEKLAFGCADLTARRLELQKLMYGVGLALGLLGSFSALLLAPLPLPLGDLDAP